MTHEPETPSSTSGPTSTNGEHAEHPQHPQHPQHPTVPLTPPSPASEERRAAPTTGPDATRGAAPASHSDRPGRTDRTGRPGPRTGPIVWGALILAFCAYIAQRVFGAGGLDVTGWITVTVLGIGVLLLGVGIAVIVRNRRRSQDAAGESFEAR